jgi:bifunctional N-acetylglucosamine-1-phosphate-uridyltransferase/glucosamine-1-phosphate-acetyltransferase GlmU-like protein
MKLCAVVPAAGLGSRLGATLPKILVEVVDGVSIWDIMRRSLAPFVDHIDVVVSPRGRPLMEAALSRATDRAGVSISVQPEPRGMGDAVFQAFPVWSAAENVLVIWGDQVHVSPQTLARSRDAHLSGSGPRGTLPVVSLPEPYVEYVFDADDRLVAVQQSREGDRCSPGGWGDVGTFLLATDGLLALWQEYIASTPGGAVTGELNFLPFLVFLSERGWPMRRVPITDPNEARGINTVEDLRFFRELYSRDVDAWQRSARPPAGRGDPR